jgi:hypothetical protein
MKFVWVITLALSLTTLGFAQQSGPAKQSLSPATGLPTGEIAPAFSLRDQFGRERTLESVKGPKGTVLLFFRSADW